MVGGPQPTGGYNIVTFNVNGANGPVQASDQVTVVLGSQSTRVTNGQAAFKNVPSGYIPFSIAAIGYGPGSGFGSIGGTVIVSSASASYTLLLTSSSVSGVFLFLAAGVGCVSSSDPNVSNPAGSVYQFDVKFVVPWISVITADLSILAVNILNALATALPGSTFTNLTVVAVDDYTLRISFTASSPPILAAILPWLGVIIVTALILGITALLFPPGSGGVTTTTGAIGMAAIAALGIGALLILGGGGKGKGGGERRRRARKS